MWTQLLLKEMKESHFLASFGGSLTTYLVWSQMGTD